MRKRKWGVDKFVAAEATRSNAMNLVLRVAGARTRRTRTFLLLCNTLRVQKYLPHFGVNVETDKVGKGIKAAPKGLPAEFDTGKVKRVPVQYRPERAARCDVCGRPRHNRAWGGGTLREVATGSIEATQAYGSNRR